MTRAALEYALDGTQWHSCRITTWTSVPSGRVVALADPAGWTGPQPPAGQQFYRVEAEY